MSRTATQHLFTVVVHIIQPLYLVPGENKCYVCVSSGGWGQGNFLKSSKRKQKQWMSYNELTDWTRQRPLSVVKLHVGSTTNVKNWQSLWMTESLQFPQLNIWVRLDRNIFYCRKTMLILMIFSSSSWSPSLHPRSRLCSQWVCGTESCLPQLFHSHCVFISAASNSMEVFSCCCCCLSGLPALLTAKVGVEQRIKRMSRGSSSSYLLEPLHPLQR